jgi:DNA-binding transcriptional ArsR family regulator
MLKSKADTERTANVLKLLGDKTRLTIVGILKQRECCVCEFLEVN